MKRRIAALAASNFLAPLLQFAASPVLTRIYSPESMGGFAVAYSAAAILALLFTGQVHQALVSEENLERAEHLFQEILLAALTVYLFCSLLLFTGLFDPWFGFLVLSLGFLTALGQVLAYYLSRQGRLKIISLLLLIRASAVVATQIALGNITATKESLLLGALISEVCFFFSGISVLGSRTVASAARGIMPRLSLASIRRHRNYPLRYLPSQLVALGTNFAPLALASHVGATGSAGLFAFSLRLVQAPAASITNAVRMSFWRPEAGQKNLYLAARKISWLGHPFVALTGLAAFLLPDSVYVLVFGSKWTGISTMLACVFLWVGSSVVTQFAAEILKHTGRQGVILRTEISGAILKAIFLFGLFMDISTTVVLAAFALAGFFYNLLAAQYYLLVANNDMRRTR